MWSWMTWKIGHNLQYPEYFTIYLSIYWKKKINLSGSFFWILVKGVRGEARFKQFGSKNGRQMALDNATMMFSIKNVCYQRIKYETFYKLGTEKFKNTMLYTPWYSGYNGN